VMSGAKPTLPLTVVDESGLVCLVRHSKVLELAPCES